MIIGKDKIMKELGLVNVKKLFILVKAFGCPIRFKANNGHGHWIGSRQEISDWLNARIIGDDCQCSKPHPTISSIREDLVIGRKPILDVLKIDYNFEPHNLNNAWQEVLAIKQQHNCPIALIGNRWMTRLTLMDQWFNQQLREGRS